jgi:hypothetical protein
MVRGQISGTVIFDEVADVKSAGGGPTPPKRQDLLRRVIEWAERLDTAGLVALAMYRGKNEVTTLLPRLRGDGVGLATANLEPKACC